MSDEAQSILSRFFSDQLTQTMTPARKGGAIDVLKRAAQLKVPTSGVEFRYTDDDGLTLHLHRTRRYRSIYFTDAWYRTDGTRTQKLVMPDLWFDLVAGEWVASDEVLPTVRRKRSPVELVIAALTDDKVGA